MALLSPNMGIYKLLYLVITVIMIIEYIPYLFLVFNVGVLLGDFFFLQWEGKSKRVCIGYVSRLSHKVLTRLITLLRT